ncbi:Hypothetical protein LUCI_0628 [Lucifera butyrica]|uniref:histidine kinase n=1 Tax=Lucifera butyrica TaxID=1351585 RepID=A0A498R2M8_9FIRM|nr:ATP-binding protein [Lucifera butyrica]VBB05419.1 Hypothetical protein LUCI_0628 [Lucifera butyrica]
MSNSRSLTRVLTMQFLLLVVVPLAAISILTLQLLTKELDRQITSKNLLLASSMADQVDAFLQDAEMALRQVDAVMEVSRVDERKQRYLEAWIRNYPYFESLQILNRDGRVRYIAPYRPHYTGISMAGQPFYKEALSTGVIYWSPVFISQQTGQPTLTVTLPTSAGMVVGFLNLGWLSDVCIQATRDAPVWGGIIDKEGTIIGHSDRRLVNERTNLGDAGFVRRSLRVQSGTYRDMVQGQDTLISLVAVNRTGWRVGVFQSAAQAFRPVEAMRNIFIAGSCLAVALALFLALWLLRKILNPLADLTNHTRQIADGCYDLVVPTGDFKEFDELAGHFQTMSEAVRSREEDLSGKRQELENSMVTLEKRNRELDQFAYVASHDLKAPLRAIANLSQWMEDDLGPVITGETRRHMELLRGRVKRMENLIEGILQYSRVGRIVTGAEPVDVEEMVQDIVQELEPLGGLSVRIEGSLPVITAERVRLRQVFANLIGNAVKYHNRPVGGNVVIAGKREDSCYAFTVADDGPGIAPVYHEKIFEMFQTLQPRDRVESTGVGLALVKKIVEGQGGQITVHSQEGEGATFCFTWPVQDSTEL